MRYFGWYSSKSRGMRAKADGDGAGGGRVHLHPGSHGALGGTGNIGVAPEFIDASLRLRAASPCIDAGDNTAVPAARSTILKDRTLSAYGPPDTQVPASVSTQTSMP